MAIAIPFVASALGATALQATLISVAFSVTGISAKIDKAASNVFGKDLVMLGNVLGAGYAMFNRGFDIGAGGEAAKTAATADSLFEADWSKAAGGDGGLMAGESVAGGNAFNLSEMGAAPLTEDAWNAMGAENSQYLADSGIVDMTTGLPGNVDAKVSPTTPETAAAQAPTAQQPQATGAASAQAAAPTATASSATAGNATAAQATDQIVPNATQAKAAADVLSKQLAPYQQPSNIFERMFYTTDKAGNRVFNDRLAGGVIQGLGSAASGYMQSQEAAKGLKWQQDKYNTRIGGRVTG